jgi:endonuclease/exonuclease/phosphatase family metal-dependent hydrolase
MTTARAAAHPAFAGSLALATNGPGRYLTWTWQGNKPSSFVVEQAADAAFTTSVHSYKVRGVSRAFTPYLLTRGATLYFRVRAVVNGHTSKPSPARSFVAGAPLTPVRVLAYNSLSASYDGEQHPGGTAAPWSKRRAGQVALLNGSNADVIGVEEAATCLHERKALPCWRQIDSLASGLTGYKLDATYQSTGRTRYFSDYILFNNNTVAKVGTGHTFKIGPSGKTRYAAYQIFQVRSTGVEFLFVVTHTLATAGAKGDKIRGAETTSLVRQAKAYARNHSIHAIIYSGDFNTYAGEYQVNDVSGNNMRAAHIPDGIDVAQHHTNSKYDSINALYRSPKKGGGSADHIYASGGVGVKLWGELLHLRNGRFVGTIPSDHNPVYADVLLP